MLPTTVVIYLFYVQGNVMKNHLNCDLETRIEVHFELLGP